MDFLLGIFFIGYIISLLFLLPYPLNYIYLAFKSRNWIDPVPASYYSVEELPDITIHLPVYNEPLTIESTLQQLLKLDYPREKLNMFIIDDSTDSTTEKIVNFIQDFNKDDKIQLFMHIRREDRSGYKAGALKYALEKTMTELIAFIDADFKLYPNFLKNAVHHFKDNPKISAVQCRWTHYNRTFSSFTRAMSIPIDGHFFIEKTGQTRTNGFVSFNGTAGLWRKSAIIKAGGWLSRTVAEDLDLAFRTQLQGNRVLYLREITADQEITPTIRNWAIQQTRWAKGFTQNFRIHLRRVLFQPHNKNKFQGLITLSAYFLPLFLVINLICGSLLLYMPDMDYNIMIALGTILGFVSTLGILMYGVAIVRANRPIVDILLIPFFLFWGISLCVRISYGVISGLFFRGGEFIRTPKYNLVNGKAVDSMKKSKIPLDKQFIFEILFFMIIFLGFIKSLEFPLLFFTSIFLGMILLSIFNLLVSNITHAITKTNLV